MRIIAIIAGIMMLFYPLASFTSPVTSTAENALLPEGKLEPTRTTIEQPRPLYPGCGEILIGKGTCTIYDGFIDEEWENATVYDISDTCGQSDGYPNDPGSVYLYLMRDDVALYIGVDAVTDPYEDYYDGSAFYFDENDDGCWPTTEITNEGNIWVKDDLAGGIRLWRWWQDDNCIGQCNQCLDYEGSYTNLGGFYDIEPCGTGFGTASGHMQLEVGIHYGALADEEWEIQTHFELGETCGFYMYYLDQYSYDFMGEMPCTGASNTYIWPCSWPSLVGVKPDFTFSMEPFQTQVPIGGTLDFAKHFQNNTCQSMTIYDTVYAFKDGKVLEAYAFEWTLECEQDLDICFALQVPEKDQFICWDITIVNSGVAVAGGDEYPFEESFDIHIEPGHKSEIICL